MKFGPLVVGRRTIVVAEISCNHAGDKRLALDLIDAASEAGADAVKFQLWMDPAHMAPDTADPRFVLQAGPWAGRKLYDLYREAWTPPSWFPDLFSRAIEVGVVPFAAVFDLESVGYLESLDCAAYKIASPEITFTPLVNAVVETGKPVIISTGMATQADVTAAWLRAPEAIFLHCVSAYPAPLESMNVRRLVTLPSHFKGLSDHSHGSAAACAAVALGACMVEKHLMLPETATLDKEHSVTPDEFARLVEDIRTTEAVLGSGHWIANPAETASHGFKRRYYDGIGWMRGSA